MSFLTHSVREQICEILLDRSADGIRPDDNIIEIGLTSLSTLELRARIGAVAGVRLSIESILGNPTPEAIARLVLSELTGRAHDE
ncbi:acyl carrier protein [Nocardia brasiliensis]|uniref:acyl carrier protein n=1 Tax=Nocardia brasiliensis TaxID=37326 RepID=UPI003D775C8E